MKIDELNLFLGILALIDLIVLLIIYLSSIGYDGVASYNNYVIGGFEAFLILENLKVFFYSCLLLLFSLVTIILYRIIRR
nr:hypothetical protein [uncultured Tyzzerella sp.]